ncbi:MAG TPA: thioesterase domain-containing protein [Hyphomicrobiales bacterium]|jgi:pimeloyl-ACP methyl ester carboxylesterase
MTEGRSAIGGSQLHAELLGIWCRLLETASLSIDDDFFESGGDSLLATEMVREVERRLGKSIPPSLLFEASTIRLLAEFLSGPAMQHPKPVFPVVPFGKKTPLLFFHGDWTNGGFYLKLLTHALGAEQPMIAVAPHGFHGEKVPPTVEEMAADRLAQILALQPHGPYRLGGHCVGGKVALETARLLLARGEQVEAVVMVDPVWPVDGRPWPEIKTPPPGSYAEKVVDALRRRSIGAAKLGYRHIMGRGQIPTLLEQYDRALAIYVPQPIAAPVIVFSSQYDGGKWRDVSPDFVLFEEPGAHYDWVTVNAGMFAEHLRKRFESVGERPDERALRASSISP